MREVFRVCGIVSVVGLLALGLPACGGGGGGSSTAKATFVMDSNDTSKSDGAVILTALLGKNHADDPGGVDINDIEHLFVDVTQIVLHHAPGTAPDEEEDDGNNVVEVSNNMFDPVTIEIDQGESVTWLWIEQGLHTVTSGCNNCPDEGDMFNELMFSAGGQIVIAFPDAGAFPYFSDVQADIEAGMTGTVIVNAAKDASHSGSTQYAKDHGGAHPKIVIPVDLTVDLKDLSVIGEVLSADETIPAGKFTGITLHIENPDLRLTSDPNTPITDIHLTANGRLFIKKVFNIPANDEVIIVLNFGGVHLVQTSGFYVLTPQLRADVDVLNTEVMVQGVITALNCGTGMMTIDDNGTIYEVMLTMDTVILDATDAMVDCANLNGDEFVVVTGTLDPSLTVVADQVEVETV